jgi:hypothetical protein
MSGKADVSKSQRCEVLFINAVALARRKMPPEKVFSRFDGLLVPWKNR